MTTVQQINITSPVGRLVMGSLYKPQTTDADGNPLVYKQGPSAGQPKVDFFFALAIPKGAEQHWAQTEWGAKIWAAGHSFFPTQAQHPSFAWKVIDGDSQVANLKGKKPADREGYARHWVLAFSSGYAPKIYNKDGTQQIVEPDAVKLGYFAQVNFNVTSNGSQQKPGVKLYHSMVALAAYGPEITIGPDAASAGFGNAALPAGAMATPPAGFNPAAAAVAPAGPAAYMPPATMPAPAGMMPPPPAAPPNPAFLQVGAPPVAPGVPAVPMVPVAPPAAPVRQMTAKAAGATYESFIGQGWNDALLVQHGYMAG